jgi:hypothetical protein
MKKLEMFLSHVHVESRFADFIEEAVERDFIGLVNVFVASDGGIIAGTKWLDELTDRLKNSDVHVVLCSPEAMTRHWISFETGSAHLRQIPIIPLCHSGLAPNQLPVPLSEFQAILLCESEKAAASAMETGLEAFYRAIANVLGSNVPHADFARYEQQLIELEETYANERVRLAEGGVAETGIEIVRNPRALCISSHQFLRSGFGNQLDMVLKAFPSSVQHDRIFDSVSLKKLLRNEKVDVVHISAYVCPRSGDLYFSDVEFGTGRPLSEPVDRITADALAELLEMAGVRLAVITGSDSMALTATLLGACNVVAARDMVSPKMMATWVEEFYSMLPDHPLSKALDFALKASRAPMRLYPRQPKSIDLVMQLANGTPSSP